MVKKNIHIVKNLSAQRYVNEFQASNLSQAEFCRKHKLPDSTFSTWKKKYASSLLDAKTKIIKKTTLSTGKALKNIPVQKLNFLEIPNAINFSVNPQQTTCTIQRPDGMQLIIAAKDQQLTTLLQAFLCYN